MFRSWLVCCGGGLLVAGHLAAQAASVPQPVYYNTSSATQSLNRLNSVNTNGLANTALFTAAGMVSRCSAMAVDGLSGILFFVDGPANAVWKVNLDGTGLTLVRGGLSGYPLDLALDVLNQRVYVTTSSANQADNVVQRLDYNGAGHVTVFTATGAAGNGVSRCTALALDFANGRMFVADAGSGKVWSMSLAGDGLAAVATAPAGSFPLSLAVDGANKRVYFAASSAAQTLNSIQRVNYDGGGLTTVYEASAPVLRCTALDLNVAGGVIYMSDAAANALWRIPSGGGSATLVTGSLPATAKKVRYFNGPISRPAPGIVGISVAGTNVVLKATNGFTGGTYYVLTSTNLALPLGDWTPVGMNVLGMSGGFTVVATNGASAGEGGRFFVLKAE